MKAEVIVNGRFLSRQVTGVERYAAAILQQLSGQVRSVQPRFQNQGAAGHAWEQFALPMQVPPHAILWSPANSGPLAITNQVLSLYDLSTLEHPEWYRASFARWYRWMIPALIRRVRRVVTLSEFTRARICARFHLPVSRVVVVSPGVDHAVFYPSGSRVSPRRYILYVGTLEPRKNLSGLLAAWGEICNRHPDVDLLIVGGPGRVFSPVHYQDNNEQVRWLGYLTDDALREAYSGADVFVLPSWDEGFGLTVLEAMACGAPVVVSGSGALPEAVGDAGLTFDPYTPGNLVETLDHILADPGLRRSIREKGLARAEQFNWPTSAEKMLQVLRGANGG